MTVNQARTPPDGWHFPVTPAVTLRGTDKQVLIDRVYEWRLRQGLAVDTIEREIDDYYCTRWPDACNKEPSDYGRPNPPKAAPATLLHRVSRWAAGCADLMPEGGYPLVTPAEAARRQAVCVACPRNRPWRSGCRSCSGSAAQLLSQVRALRRGRDDAHACVIAGWDNNTASNFKVEDLPLSPETVAALDPSCWRR